MLMWIINMQKTWSNVKVQYNKYTDVRQWKLHSIYISTYLCLTRNYYFHRLWAANSPWRSWDVTKASPLLLAPLSAGDALWAARTQLHPEHPHPHPARTLTLPGPPSCQDPHPDTQLCPGKIPVATSAAPLGLDLQGKQETPCLLFQFTDTRTVLKNLKKIPTNTINHQILLKPTYKNFKRVFMW